MLKRAQIESRAAKRGSHCQRFIAFICKADSAQLVFADFPFWCRASHHRIVKSKISSTESHIFVTFLPLSVGFVTPKYFIVIRNVGESIPSFCHHREHLACSRRSRMFIWRRLHEIDAQGLANRPTCPLCKNAYHIDNAKHVPNA